MSHKMILTISNDHFAWLEGIKKERGLENIQEAVRSVLEDSYILSQRRGAKLKKEVVMA